MSFLAVLSGQSPPCQVSVFLCFSSMYKDHLIIESWANMF